MDSTKLPIHLVSITRKYRGKYIATARGKVVASAPSAQRAFELAEKLAGRRNVSGVFYIPTKQELLTALMIY